jgi:hypothetical protein
VVEVLVIYLMIGYLVEDLVVHKYNRHMTKKRENYEIKKKNIELLKQYLEEIKKKKDENTTK